MPSGTKPQASMSKTEINKDNVIKTNMEDLSKEKKKKLNEKVELYREACLDCFAAPRGGKVAQKIQFPRILMQGETAVTTGNIHQLVNEAVHHAFINQSPALVNPLHQYIKDTF
jgi:hypothetical protein